MLIKMMVEYCQCVRDIPSATPDLLTRLIDLLKVNVQFIVFLLIVLNGVVFLLLI